MVKFTSHENISRSGFNSLTP